ncbi:hypothetical protein J6P92_05260 [bacterium]|nr:hypothetical protein [bacterium]
MEEIKISAIQMNAKPGDKKSNIEKAKELIKRDVKEDTDIIVLPEVWNIGWVPSLFQANAEENVYVKTKKQLFTNDILNRQVGSFQHKVLTEKNPSCEFLSKTAKEYNSWLIGGSIISNLSGNFYNTCPVFNRKGELVATYSKNHLYSYYGCDEGKYITKGENPVMVDIEGVKVGLTICYDIRFPEIYRAYRIAGADLLINCAAWGLKKPIPWECMTRSRATENQTYFVALTQSGLIKDDEWNIGHSRIIDYKGETISEIKDQKEGAMTAVIDLKSMHEFREKCRCIDDIRENYEVKIL